MGYRHIAVAPLAGALGAEISGVDLARPVGDEAFAEIHRAFLEYQVIFFRGQDMGPAAFEAFARRFGPMSPHRFLKGLDGHPNILEFVTEPEDTHVFAQGWHADVTYQERPVLGAMLHAREVPPVGGDTLFANQYLAYENLSFGMRALLDGLRAVHGSALVYGAKQAQFNVKDGNLSTAKEEAAAAEATHPVVRTHPETGRKALFVNDHYTLRLAGMTAAESAPLLGYLFDHAIRPELTCRFRWTEGAVAFWDNRCTLHTAIADYLGQRRRMHRITIGGDRPV